jgi:hypothetical protein
VASARICYAIGAGSTAAEARNEAGQRVDTGLDPSRSVLCAMGARPWCEWCACKSVHSEYPNVGGAKVEARGQPGEGEELS